MSLIYGNEDELGGSLTLKNMNKVTSYSFKKYIFSKKASH